MLASSLPDGWPDDKALNSANDLRDASRRPYFMHNDSDFPIFRLDSYFKDNSDFIHFLDHRRIVEPHIVLLRPPRFGKSLLCSMLRAYYDFLAKESFEGLFGGLHVGRQPTEEASQYYVLFLDLSVVPRGDWGLTEVFNALDRCVNDACVLFRDRYGLSFEIDADCALTVGNAFDAVGVAARNKTCTYDKMFVIVDEYDRLPNAVMSQDGDVFQEYQRAVAKDAVAARASANDAAAAQADNKGDGAEQTDCKDASVTHANGEDAVSRASDGKAFVLESPIRRLYAMFKTLSGQRSSRNVASFRSFTTGISPVALADASLFNVATNVTTLPEVSEVLGFTAADVEDAIELADMVPEACRKPLLTLLRSWFNDYRFFAGQDSSSLFHPMLCMKVLSNAQTNRSLRNGLSKLLGMQLHDCDAPPPRLSSVMGEGVDAAAMPRLPPAFVDVSNVTIHTDVVALLARRWAEVSSFSYDELFAVGSLLPAKLLQVAFKQAELLATIDYPGCRRLDRLRLLLLYHGLLTCCGEVQSPEGVTESYVLRPSNLSTSLLVRPLRTKLAAVPTSPVFLLDSPTVASVRKYLQSVTASSVRRLNEYGYQQGVLKWHESWLASSARSDISVTAETRLEGKNGARYSDIVLRDCILDRVVVIELKHIPLGQIDVDKWLGGRIGKTAVKDFLRGKPSKLTLTDDDLLDLFLDPTHKPHRLVDGRGLDDIRVRDVLDGAVLQLKEQLQSFRDAKTLTAFVLLQVHRRAIVFPVEYL